MWMVTAAVATLLAAELAALELLLAALLETLLEVLDALLLDGTTDDSVALLPPPPPQAPSKALSSRPAAKADNFFMLVSYDLKYLHVHTTSYRSHYRKSLRIS